MIQPLILIFIACVIIILMYYRLIQIDFTFPLLIALIGLGFIGINNELVIKIASFFKIYNEPLAIVFLTFFICLSLIVVLLVAYTQIRLKQIQLVRKIAVIELKNKK